MGTSWNTWSLERWGGEGERREGESERREGGQWAKRGQHREGRYRGTADVRGQKRDSARERKERAKEKLWGTVYPKFINNMLKPHSVSEYLIPYAILLEKSDFSVLYPLLPVMPRKGTIVGKRALYGTGLRAELSGGCKSWPACLANDRKFRL